jgi:hypothetical protein
MLQPAQAASGFMLVTASRAGCLGETTRQLTATEGVALRAIIFEHDQLPAFGGLRRVQAPAGDLLWVCKDHYPDYDPGLPVIH